MSMSVFQWIAGLPGWAIALIAVTTAMVVTAGAVLAACSRPHLRNSTTRGALVKRFPRERETMFVPLMQRAGLTTEFEGILVTADPQLARTLMMTKSHTATRSRFYTFSRYALYGMDGVLSMHGEVWRKHTRALAKLFHTANVARYTHVLHAAATRNTRAWAAGVAASYDESLLPRSYYGPSSGTKTMTVTLTGKTNPDLLSAVRGIGMEVLLRWGAGVDPRHPLGRALASAFARYGALVGALGQKPLKFGAQVLALHACTQELRGLAKQVLAVRAKHAAAVAAGMAAKPVAPTHVGGADDPTTTIVDDSDDRLLLGDGSDALALMAAPQPAGTAPFTLAEMAAELNHVHGAHKAVLYVVTHVLHDLCQPPYAASGSSAAGDARQHISDAGGVWWAERLRAEALRELGEHGVPTRDDIAPPPATGVKLPLLRSVILEATRRHVVSLGVVRQTGEPLRIGETVIPTGTEVVVLLQALHHLPCYWVRPYEFRPERWLTPAELEAALRKESPQVAAGVAITGPVVGSALPVFQYTAAAAAAAAGEQGEGEEEGEDGADAASSARGAASKAAASFSTGSDVAGRVAAALAAAPAGSAAAAVAAPSPFSATEGAIALPARGSAQEAQLVASGAIRPSQACFMPFLTGARMCAGKALAETELAVTIAGVLRALPVGVLPVTGTRYLGHVNGVPVGTGVGGTGEKAFHKHHAAAATATGAKPVPVQPASADGIAAGDVSVVPGYGGPVSLMLQDNMYAGIDGEIPFSVGAVATPA